MIGESVAEFEGELLYVTVLEVLGEIQDVVGEHPQRPERLRWNDHARDRVDRLAASPRHRRIAREVACHRVHGRRSIPLV
ncbi:MAG: hypothetical protein ACREIS_09620 [Nitrospiraceae bacterium]